MYPPIDYNRVFTRIPEIMGLELTYKRNWWEGAYYLNGEPHRQRDKLKVKLQRGEVWAYEQGGEAMPLPKWLVTYGGCADYKAAFNVIRGGDRPVTEFVARSRKQTPTLYVPKSDYEAMREFDLHTCPLFRWMCGMFGEERTRETWERYHICTDSKGRAVFFYTDANGRICHDKRIYYYCNGKRIRKYGCGREYKVGDGYSGRALFGEHLIKDAEVVNIVESEKSACLAALYFGDRKGLWLGVGGKGNIKNLLSNIQGKKIRLFPDADTYEEWSTLGYEVVNWISCMPNLTEHDDIGDFVVYKVEEWRRNRYR